MVSNPNAAMRDEANPVEEESGDHQLPPGSAMSCFVGDFIVTAKYKKVFLHSLATKSPVGQASPGGKILHISPAAGQKCEVLVLTDTALHKLEVPSLAAVSTAQIKEAFAKAPEDAYAARSVGTGTLLAASGKGELSLHTNKKRVYLGKVSSGLLDCNPSGGLAFAASSSSELCLVRALDKLTRRTYRFPKDRPLTCLALHPSQEAVLVGDGSGRVAVVKKAAADNESNDGELMATFGHWHSLPVGAVAWECHGDDPGDSGHFYSGGGEATLVKWSPEVQKVSLAPRLGAPITSLASGTHLVSSCHLDLSVRCFSHQLELVFHLNLPLLLTTPDSSPLAWHAPTATVAYARGRGGSTINFFDAVGSMSDSAVIDVDETNIVRGRREAQSGGVPPKLLFSITGSGSWMATGSETVARLWEFHQHRREFKVSARIVSCHDRELAGLTVHERRTGRFSADDREDVVLVTRGNDRKIRIWIRQEQAAGGDAGGGSYLGLLGTACYKGLQPTSHAVSQDSTIVAASFAGGAVALWSMEDLCLRATFKAEVNPKEGGASDMAFVGSSLLVCSGVSGVDVWDCVTASVAYRLDLPGSRLRLTPSKELLLLHSNALFLLSHPENGSPDLTKLNQESAGGPVVDAVADDLGSVWVLGEGGELAKVSDGLGGQRTVSSQRPLHHGVKGRSLLAGVPVVVDRGVRAGANSKWIQGEVELSKPLSRNLTDILRTSL